MLSQCLISKIEVHSANMSEALPYGGVARHIAEPGESGGDTDDPSGALVAGAEHGEGALVGDKLQGVDDGTALVVYHRDVFSFFKLKFLPFQVVAGFTTNRGPFLSVTEPHAGNVEILSVVGVGSDLEGGDGPVEHEVLVVVP